VFGLCNHSASVGECHWVKFFPHGGIQLHTFVSYALPCQAPFCQTDPLLSSVAWQQNLTEYWREGLTSTAISTFASDIVGQHNKIGGINFGAALVLNELSRNVRILFVTNLTYLCGNWINRLHIY
jgi:hypothetical protein